jgi:hypothetical protein
MAYIGEYADKYAKASLEYNLQYLVYGTADWNKIKEKVFGEKSRVIKLMEVGKDVLAWGWWLITLLPKAGGNGLLYGYAMAKSIRENTKDTIELRNNISEFERNNFDNVLKDTKELLAASSGYLGAPSPPPPPPSNNEQRKPGPVTSEFAREARSNDNKSKPVDKTPISKSQSNAPKVLSGPTGSPFRSVPFTNANVFPNIGLTSNPSSGTVIPPGNRNIDTKKDNDSSKMVDDTYLKSNRKYT